jgi:hypothetical protein
VTRRTTAARDVKATAKVEKQQLAK